MWAQILEDSKRIDALTVKQNAVSKRITEIISAQAALTEKHGLGGRSEPLDSELESKLRENIRLGEQIQEEGEVLKDKMQILAALRNAQESESASRSASVGKSQRERITKRKLTDTLDDRDGNATDSAGGHPSPKVMVSSKDRLKMVSGGSRAGSVPAGRESSVKVEDSQDGQDQKVSSEKHRPMVDSEVLYRSNKMRSQSQEGEGILCRVTAVIGEGKQRRYEIIDADPDPPTPVSPYRASVNHLVPIPPPQDNFTLPELKVGRQVLAQYPGTTTFYKAEVVGAWNGKEAQDVKGGEFVRLRFEGEDEADREMSVERRYVLPDK